MAHLLKRQTRRNGKLKTTLFSMPHTGSRVRETGGPVSIRARRCVDSCAFFPIRHFVAIGRLQTGGGGYRTSRVEPINSQSQKPIPMKTIIFAKYLAVVLAAGLTSFTGTAEAAIVSLDAPFTITQNYGKKYLNFDGTSLTGSDSRGSNSATLMDIYGNFYFTDTTTFSNYAYDSINNVPLRFSYGDIVSALTTDFTYANISTSPSDSSLTYFVVGFYNNANVNSFPESNPPNPNNDFIATSNLAWLAVSRSGGDITVEAAGVNTVAGGSIAVGEYVAPSTSSVPEIDPATGGSALSLVAGVLAMIEQRRRRRGSAAALTA